MKIVEDYAQRKVDKVKEDFEKKLEDKDKELKAKDDQFNNSKRNCIIIWIRKGLELRI